MSSELDFTKSTFAKGFPQDVVADSVCIAARLAMTTPCPTSALWLLSGAFSSAC